MEGKPVRMKVGRFTLEGHSIAGDQTAIRVNELNVCFDVGKAPLLAVRSPIILLSHAHQDHLAGVSYYFSNRNFRGMSPGLIVLPKSIEADVRALMRMWRKLEQYPIPFKLRGVRSGQRFSIGRRIEALAFETDHLGPSLGYCLLDVRQKLLPKYEGLAPQQIQAIARTGKPVSRNVRVPLVTYLGDTQVGRLDLPEAALKADVMLVECTFLAPEHRTRAAAGKHVHIADLVPFLERVRSRHIVLHHFSTRYSLEQIPALVARSLPEELKGRVRLFLPPARRGRTQERGA